MDEPTSPTSPRPDLPHSGKTARKWLMATLRWGIAVVGIWWVLSQISFSDKVLVVQSSNIQQPVAQMSLTTPDAGENDPAYHVVGRTVPVLRSEVLNKPDKKNQILQFRDAVGKTESGKLLGLDLTETVPHQPRRFYIQVPEQPAQWIAPQQLLTPYDLKVPYPRVDIGVARLIRQASQKNLWLLVLAIVVFPITCILTAFRWHELLKALDIRITLSLTFTLNMVGAFYNTFMLGSTGGDVLKALYISRQTPHRTRAVMSVFVDRVIGLLALIIIGCIAAATQWHIPQCRHIAIVSMVILAGTALGLLIFYQPTLHRLFGLDWIIAHLPMQKQVHNAMEVMMIYRRRPGLVLLALVATFPVHITVILSAMFAGLAFDLPLAPSYYWAIVPVIVLIASIPISPQGAGVMEYFAVRLTETRGATVSQAFALTMSIRLVQILWNLTGAYFVLRGHFHAPTEADREEFRQDIGED